MHTESLGGNVQSRDDGDGEPSTPESSSTTDYRISNLEQTSSPTAKIPVHISYEIIKLFSEGLYQSPQKAVEELVSNSYDADATTVHVILPHVPDSDPSRSSRPLDPLWVIDNGHGMDQAGFAQLWRVAGSAKISIDDQPVIRRPIGQFGIGKLAAYVLAWRLTHVSMVEGQILLTSMNFRRLDGLHQYNNASPIDVDLLAITEEEAKELLSDIRARDSAAWSMLFGDNASETWTVAALTDFKNLYEKLHAGRLSWVLSTGLPLHSEFEVWLNGNQLASSKEQKKTVATFVVGGVDSVASALEFTSSEEGVEIPEVGMISGEARIFESKLTDGKSDQYGRSNGFFIRVRGRVINLEDELFGISALNHAAWSRFSMEVDADGLRQHLLSSREGVRESLAIDGLRKYLHGVFNVCRRAYEEWSEKKLMGLDVEYLLKGAPSVYVTEPLVESVRHVVNDNQESYYVAVPEIPDGVESPTWLTEFESAVGEAPFGQVVFEKTGIFDRAVRYIPDSRTLVVNVEHPFIEKLLSSGRTRAAATLFGSTEVMIDVLMQDHGFSRASIIDFLADRDRVLRLAAGEEPSTAAEVLRRLHASITNETALERAVGLAFRVLGFEYERRGGNVGGTDGVLYARLGRGGDKLDDYKVVYDAKQTSKPAVPADKVNIGSLEDFRVQENANFGFFVATDYAGQNEPDSKLNRLLKSAVESNIHVTMLRLDDIRRLVELHYQYGVTLTRLRSLFGTAHTVPEVSAWVDELENELRNLEPNVPLMKLLSALEESKYDEYAEPNVYSARQIDQSLKPFPPERLSATLSAVETIIGKRWIEVETKGGVRLHHTAEQIVAEVERNLRDLLGVNPISETTDQE